MRHITVLQKEAVDSLRLLPGSVVVDCTLGSGGHAREILSRLDASGVYVGLDVDDTALAQNETLKDAYTASVHLVHANFRDIHTTLSRLGIQEPDAILADLGWRAEQFEGETTQKKGFSFKNDEPLYMTFGDPEDYPFTAYDIINDWKEEDIANVLYAYAEETFSRRIARAICEARRGKPIETSGELAQIVTRALPHWVKKRKIHPATKTFQALRIAVNDEFDALRQMLEDGFALLRSGGRLSVITFHSLEDRIVKETFKLYAHDQSGVLVTKKPLAPSIEERKSNPRARSAKLRTIEKV